MYIWSKLKHENVLPFLGYIQDAEYPCLVSEWIENGSLAVLLRHDPMSSPISHNPIGKRIVSQEVLYSCIYTEKPQILGIAKGISYLHASNVVHSDIKPVSYTLSHVLSWVVNGRFFMHLSYLNRTIFLFLRPGSRCCAISVFLACSLLHKRLIQPRGMVLCEARQDGWHQSY